MTSLVSTSSASQRLHKNACSICARRKVKCDKVNPCSNCIKSQSECSYDAPATHRPRKRVADEDLLARLARYEDLMRKNNIDYTQSANTWVPSGLEAKSDYTDIQSPIPVVLADAHPSSNTCPSENSSANAQLCLWSTLSSELKFPPLQSLRNNDDLVSDPTDPLQLVFSNTEPKLEGLHPEAKHIYRLWQTFVENVNPLIKIIHVPTIQQRVLDACWHPESLSKSLTAILFTVYTLAITSMSSTDCYVAFGETRSTLFTRYRTAALRALIEVGFLTSRDFEVLQAFVMFLYTDTDSELTSSLCGAAVRIAHKMGLQRGSTDPKISVFDREMRIRLWWQLFGIDCRCLIGSNPGTKPPIAMFGEVPLPLNVNDVDLHPDMTEPPTEHNTPTEMMCILTKSQTFNLVRSSAPAAKAFEGVVRVSTKSRTSTEMEDDVIDHIESMYQEQRFGRWDTQIPLHNLAYAISNLTIAHMRLKVHHPRGRAAATGGEVYMTQRESDMVFESALTLLEMVDIGFRSNFSSRLFAHMTGQPHMPHIDAYIYVLSDLRQRCSGDRVALAWRLVGDLYNDHPELIEDGTNRFFVAFGDLTLEAWQARRKELVTDRGASESDLTPQFIQLLWDKRQDKSENSLSISTALDSHDLDVMGFTDDGNLDWEYWNNVYF
ncbi:hypothetical protein G7Z17_g2987 [Cylindrodendrum hubeiense]|uniref:Zn(2)-C6 fungal-type domain-containing protein n=1 Tax=Cylindrodendrum hubeiense TaxID=595255 RepID=A0A9P5LB67_9HYPO|nr:hypothetical protein G7Z17_g2987 [Cylindrodendrum hubeiense]